MNRAAFAAILIAAITALSMTASMPSMEAEVTDTWDGTADISWYDGMKTEYHIDTAEKLAGLAQIVNGDPAEELEGITVYLDADLDISGHEWDAIGQGNNASGFFGGIFDGQGHEVRGLTQHEAESIGLFSVIGMSGAVRNLGVTEADIDYTGNRLDAGILASWVDGGVIEDCYSTGSMYIGMNMLIGGLIGQCTAGARVIGCYSSADVTVNTPGEDMTVGGVIGQWENSTDASLIKDCYFSGSIHEIGAGGAAVGGILGANFDFSGQPGVDIEGCFVTATDLVSSNMDNILWIGALVDGNVSNCYWPSEPEERMAVVKMVVNWDAGTASADPDFDQSTCGSAVTDFSTDEFLQTLNGGGSTWVAGPDGHPIHSWDAVNHPADYTEVEEAVAIAEGLDGSDYSNWETVQSAIDAVDWDLTFDRQAEVDAMAQVILDSIDGLEHALPPFIPFPPEQGGDPVEVYPSEDNGSSSDGEDGTLKVVAVAAAAVIAAILAIVLASTYRK